MVKNLENLEQTLAYQFSNPDLAQLALTHRSANQSHNERLEFLGDSLLGFLIAEHLHTENPDASEGELSRMRASLVSKAPLAEVARRIGLGKHLLLGSGERSSGGSDRDSILADAVEALIAAIYIDGGLEPCRKVVLALCAGENALASGVNRHKDAKTSLQELLQARAEPLPQYVVQQVSGPAHAQTFHVRCTLSSSGIAVEGSGNSKREAEQRAAENALKQIEGKKV